MPSSRKTPLLLPLLFVSHSALAVDTGALYTDPAAIRVLLAAEVETTLSSKMGGTLDELHASLGQTVDKGKLLAQFDCREGQARAKVTNAELTMAKQNLEAKRQLRKLDAVGDLEVAMAATEVEKADGARSMAQTQVSYCKVVAPFTGRIAKVHAKPHQTVSAGAPLFDLVGAGTLKVRMNVPSRLLTSLQLGSPLQINISETGKDYAAKVSAINSRVDAVAQSVELEATLDAEHPELIAGMSGVARLADNP
ncbi:MULTISPECIES: efflux RND transporter periplasmic adaptor subunit [unclassified Pseudomonas]|uniref:efflux RND transporter periplasmic adaptor subunit n=1 Tax=unclassified Pseudomonas TaxID=196821 RepID=UPI00244D111E|nr:MULTISPECIES: efflux RND transporter periplasmic adaptor subunit [unclassified Pseudomonas]MDG9925673.1 efflux RND transporter periplasmic adaptor subunit [Pseudomonas sp. GD04045]MDH0037210.1 efflux RND transporter periplasmic adaptor subunit [Pseudomonas sp. GD04019]